MSSDFQPIADGILVIPHGQLLLPRSLLVGDDVEAPVAWAAWEGPPWQVRGTAGPLRLDATVATTGGLHVRLEILNLGAEPVELRAAAWRLVVEQPDRIELVPECGIATARPWDFNLTHDTLTDHGRLERSLCLAYGDERWFVGSADPMLYADGHVRAGPESRDGDQLRIDWHRVEPRWEYNGLLATRPLNGLWIYEGQTRLATLAIAADVDALAPPVPAPSKPGAPTASAPARAASRRYDRTATMEAIKRMRIVRGEYAGLFGGGYDHRNQRIVEPHACRAEYGEFLLREFLRTGDDRLWPWIAEFAERFEHVCVNRSSHPERGGAVRGRYGDNNTAHPIRSMRGAGFFWEMADLTGVESYRRTARGIADYLARVFPWTNARQGAAVRDLVYMRQVTGDERYLDSARQIVAALATAQQPAGGWFEYWDERGDAFVYDSQSHHGGEWATRAHLKPEMASYNVNGLLDALALDSDALPGASDVVRRAADWLADTQAPEGAWPFPGPTSRGLYGYGLMLDAAAMLKAGRFFGEERFLAAGLKAIDLNFATVDETGFTPALIGVPDVDQLEASLTCFYALEAFAVADDS